MEGKKVSFVICVLFALRVPCAISLLIIKIGDEWERGNDNIRTRRTMTFP